MIIVTGEIEIAAEDLDRAVPAAIDMMRETAKESGCIHYRFSSDIEFPTRIRIYEEWEDRPSLDAHMNTPHMAVWRTALSGLKVLSRDIKIVEVAAVTPL